MMALLCVLTLASCADLLSTTKFERGTRTDEAYTNTSAGLAFVKPSGWVFYTDDQLEQTFKVSKDLLKDPDAMDKADVSSCTSSWLLIPPPETMSVWSLPKATA